MVVMKIYRKYFLTAAIVWAACFVVFLLVYMFALRPQEDSEKRLENRLAETKLLHESALEAAQKETRIRINADVERLRDRLGDFVVDFEDSANLTFDISQIATEKKVSSFSIKSRNTRKVSTGPDSGRINENYIDIDFGAGFNEFANFLNALERHRPVLFVDTFTVTSSEQEGQAYRVSMDVVYFVRKQEDSDTTDSSLAHAQDVKI